MHASIILVDFLYYGNIRNTNRSEFLRFLFFLVSQETEVPVDGVVCAVDDMKDGE